MDRIADIFSLLVVAAIVTTVVNGKQTSQEVNAVMKGFAENLRAATGR